MRAWLLLTTLTMMHACLLHYGGLQEVLKQERPVQYNKEDPLNPFFVVYGKRIPSN
jgi:hypothetical protein